MRRLCRWLEDRNATYIGVITREPERFYSETGDRITRITPPKSVLYHRGKKRELPYTMPPAPRWERVLLAIAKRITLFVVLAVAMLALPGVAGATLRPEVVSYRLEAVLHPNRPVHLHTPPIPPGAQMTTWTYVDHRRVGPSATLALSATVGYTATPNVVIRVSTTNGRSPVKVWALSFHGTHILTVTVHYTK